MQGIERGCETRLVHQTSYERYDFSPQHPLTPRRMQTGVGLIEALGLAGGRPLAFPAATDEELARVHAPAYVSAVQRLSAYVDDPPGLWEAERWGLGRGDTPGFAGMHEVSAAIAGGTLGAVRGVLDGTFDHAFVPSGGLHHAMRERAGGFCIYNDPAVGIAAALAERPEVCQRVLYLDFDVHHGDGVQFLFYDDPRVLTFSIHESGRYLFPGTGFTHEIGEGNGNGYSLNLPMEPYTDDAVWIDALEQVLPLLVDRFEPDLIVSQHGCDSHAWDLLAHLRLSTRAFEAQARLVHDLAHRGSARGRWIGTGGGGYDWVRVVPRSWVIVLATMRDETLPETLPGEWRKAWEETGEKRGLWPLPTAFHDDPASWEPIAQREEIEQVNRAHLADLLRAIDVSTPLWQNAARDPEVR